MRRRLSNAPTPAGAFFGGIASIGKLIGALAVRVLAASSPALGALTSLVLTWAVLPSEARACGATCDVPEFWELHFDVEGRLTIVSNFGLLQQTDGDWFLVCEAAVGGGLITDAELTGEGPFVSTTEGLYAQRGAACSYEPIELGAGDDWPLSFSGTGVQSDARQYALVLDRDADELLVLQRGSSGFEVLTRFARDIGYRQVVARGPWVFVTGYTFTPRTFQVAASGPGVVSGTDVDGGAPGAGARTLDASANGVLVDAGGVVERGVQDGFRTWSFYLEGEQTLLPLGGDPDRPEQLLLHAQTPSDEVAQVFTFDATRGALEHVFSLAAGEDVVGHAVAGEHQYLATQSEERGWLYRAGRANFDFQKLAVELPRLGCLEAHDEVLFACSADFTRGVPFIVGRSQDGGESWQPEMRLADLGFVDGCSGDCQPALNWLAATYGVLSLDDAAGDAGGGGLSTPGRGEPTTVGANGGMTASMDSRDDGGCSLSVASRRFEPWMTGVALLSLLSWCRRRARGSSVAYSRSHLA